jgi:hypothetical protein
VPITFQQEFLLTHFDNAFAAPFTFRIRGDLDLDRAVLAASHAATDSKVSIDASLRTIASQVGMRRL